MPSLRAAIVGGRVEVVAGRSLVGGDPTVGVVKQLRACFERGGEPAVAVYLEDKRLVQPLEQ